MEAGSGKFRREETRVLKEKILDDGGAAYEVWARNPKLATYIGLDGHPLALWGVSTTCGPPQFCFVLAIVKLVADPGKSSRPKRDLQEVGQPHL